jgi:L-asparaginase / beta-aspartyl-peptidase
VNPGSPRRPAVVVHAGAGARRPEIDQRQDDYTSALRDTVGRARAVLERGGTAIDAAEAAVMFMEDEVEFFNAGRGAALCSDGSAELSAALMRGSDRSAGAVAGVRRTRYPVAAARAVLERSPHVLLAGAAGDEFAAAAGAEQREPSYFITERQRRRLETEAPRFEGGTVGAVCLDVQGGLAAATSTGGMRGQLSGRVGDSPLIGAGTWADDRVAVSCTGDGEAFIRAGAARLLALLVAGGEPVTRAADHALAEVAALGGHGGLIALGADGGVAMPFHPGAMPRGVWRRGEEPAVWA